MTLLATLSNYYVIFPIYAKVMNIDLNAFVGFVPKVNSLASSYEGVMLFAVVPFNLVKGGLNALVTFLVYKKISKVMKTM